YVTVTDEVTRKRNRLELEAEPIFVSNAIVCRGTSCYRTIDNKHVVKFSWASGHNRETEILKRVSEKGVKGVARLVGHKRIASIGEHRDGPKFAKRLKLGGTSFGDPYVSSQQSSTSKSAARLQSLSVSKRSQADDFANPSSKKSRSNNQPSKLKQEFRPDDGSEQFHSPIPHSHQEETFRNRVLFCLVISPAGTPFREFENSKTLAQGFCDGVKAHKPLLLDAGVLHRDVSENNLIKTDPKDNDGFSGMLINLDLATEMIPGTRQFMAIKVLEEAAHTYRHDLESFFYVLIWICVSYGWEEDKKLKMHPLRRWYDGTLEDIAHTKRGDVTEGGFKKYILTNFSPTFQGVKRLAQTLRDILFSKHALETGTPDASP
ncbi:MAG: hypothetical protein Q9157_009170, partial [Trypethelium eluteriae]